MNKKEFLKYLKQFPNHLYPFLIDDIDFYLKYQKEFSINARVGMNMKIHNTEFYETPNNHRQLLEETPLGCLIPVYLKDEKYTPMPISYELLSEFKTKIDWTAISGGFLRWNFTKEFLKEFFDYFDLVALFVFNNLPDELNEHFDEVIKAFNKFPEQYNFVCWPLDFFKNNLNKFDLEVMTYFRTASLEMIDFAFDKLENSSQNEVIRNISDYLSTDDEAEFTKWNTFLNNIVERTKRITFRTVKWITETNAKLNYSNFNRFIRIAAKHPDNPILHNLFFNSMSLIKRRDMIFMFKNSKRIDLKHFVDWHLDLFKPVDFDNYYEKMDFSLLEVGYYNYKRDVERYWKKLKPLLIKCPNVITYLLLNGINVPQDVLDATLN